MNKNYIISEENKENIYNKAKSYIEEDKYNGLNNALMILKKINNYKDSNDLIKVCEKRIKYFKKRRGLRSLIITASILAIICLSIVGIVLNKISAHKVVFDTRGGSTIEIVKYYKGEEISIPTNPTKEGYAFVGWNKEIPDEMPTHRVLIKAIWQKTEVVFKENELEYIYYGEYFQDKVKDEKLIKKLKNFPEVHNIDNDMVTVEYGGSRYVKANNNYYLVSPIKWLVINKDASGYVLISDKVFTSVKDSSDPYTYMNTKFYNFAFNLNQKKQIFTDDDKYNVRLYGTEDPVEDYFFYVKGTDYAYDTDLSFDINGNVDWYVDCLSKLGKYYFVHCNPENKEQTEQTSLDQTWGIRPSITIQIDD